MGALQTIFLTCSVWKSGGACLYIESVITASCKKVSPYNTIFQLKFEHLDYENHYYIINNLFSLGTI